MGGALVAVALPVISTLLALGIVHPFGGGDALAASQVKTLEAGTSRMRIDVRTAGATPLRYTAIGRFDFREARGTFLYNLSRMTGLERDAGVEARFLQNVVYFDLPAKAEPGKPWLLIDLDRDPALLDSVSRLHGGAGTGADAVPVAPIQDPAGVLAAMDRAGDVEDLGKVTEYGLDVHKYRGPIGPAKGHGRIVATAWIGDDDLVRRLELAGAKGDATTMTFYDYGTDVTTRPPPDARVRLFGDQLKRELHAG